MSDREKCEDCVFCKELPSVSGMFACTCNVPYWAQPGGVIVDPEQLITCPTYIDKREEVGVMMSALLKNR